MLFSHRSRESKSVSTAKADFIAQLPAGSHTSLCRDGRNCHTTDIPRLPGKYFFFNLDSQLRNELATSHSYKCGASFIFGRSYAPLYRRCRACVAAFLELDRSSCCSCG